VEDAQSKSQEIRSHAEIEKNQLDETRTLNISEIVKKKKKKKKKKKAPSASNKICTEISNRVNEYNSINSQT
jgi:hypothetical protein